MKRCLIILMIGCFICSGCGKKASQYQTMDTAQEKIQASDAEWQEVLGNDEVSDFNPFPIYTNKGSRDNHYIPSGFMGDGSCLKLNDAWRNSCHSGTSCIQVIYDISCSSKGEQWAGVFWQNPANNWGSRKGGFNLTGAKRLTFWAKGEKGGERVEEIKMGGIGGDFPDSDSAFIGPVFLTPEWQKYSIDLRGKDLSYVSGGFSWSTNVDVNPNGCTFYLDDIRYE